jgi:hypothetical protein
MSATNAESNVQHATVVISLDEIGRIMNPGYGRDQNTASVLEPPSPPR